MNVLRSLLATSLLALSTTLPALATVTAGPPLVSGPQTYATTLTPDWRGVGEYDGRLTLSIDAQGIVSGYFRQADSSRLTWVTGGLSGREMWLDLGQAGLTHIDVTFDGRTIVGGTYLFGQTYTFKAFPQSA